MGSNGAHARWSVFDGVKNFPSSPESLMAEIDSAISKHEYAHAASVLQAPPLSLKAVKACDDEGSMSQYDAQMADEAYKAGLASLAAGKLDEALHSLNSSLSKCPPDKASAVAKLQSLISLTSQQLQKTRR